jgi:flavorubredoxin
MKTFEIKKNIFYCGVKDQKLEVFDIVVPTSHGTTYNSYIIKGEDKTVLVDTSKAEFFDEYLQEVESLTPIKDIDYVVMQHNEPDHSGCIERIVKLNPDITVMASPAGMGFLKEIINQDFKKHILKDREILDIGGKTLEFIMAPNLHWPDTIFTWVKEDKVLFTCDCFGAHYCPPGEKILASELNETESKYYFGEVKYYYDHIMAPFQKPFVVNALNKIKDFDIDLILTSHGPIVDENIAKVKEVYENSFKEKDFKKIVIAYVSAYGYTDLLAKTIAEGALEVSNTKVCLFDAEKTDEVEIAKAMDEADGILFGSPTILGDALKPIWTLTSDLIPTIHKGKHAAAFGSYGWTGEAVPNLTVRLKQLKLKVSDGYRVRFNPSEKQLAEAKEFGKNFALELNN